MMTFPRKKFHEGIHSHDWTLPAPDIDRKSRVARFPVSLVPEYFFPGTTFSKKEEYFSLDPWITAWKYIFERERGKAIKPDVYVEIFRRDGESFLLFLSFPRKSAHKMKCLLSLSSHAAFLTCIFHGTNIFMVNNFYLKRVLIKSKAESPLFDMYQKN